MLKLPSVSSNAKLSDWHSVPQGIFVHDVAELSRTAALEVVRAARTGWSAADLTSWLVGSFGYAASASAPQTFGARTRLTAAAEALAGRSIERCVLEMRDRVIEVALACSRGGFEARRWAQRMEDAGLVVGVKDRMGSTGWAPADVPGASCIDRVTALVVADYLTRPRDYDAIEVCEECGALSFPWAPDHESWCESGTPEAQPVSGVVARRAAF